MSFTRDVKEELARSQTEDPADLLSELTGMVQLNAKCTENEEGAPCVHMTTSNHAVARRMVELIKHATGVPPTLLRIRGPRHRKAILTLEVAPGEATEALLALRAVPRADGRSASLPRGTKVAAAFLRGAFLVAGYVASPEKPAHWEIVCPEAETADRVRRFLQRFRLKAGQSIRTDSVSVYLKDGDAIADFLNAVEAHRSLLAFEDGRAMKDLRNRVNRRLNFETANLDKTVSASMRQLELIRRLQQRTGLDVLEPQLRELAELRLKHPHATLKELGELSVPKTGKSGVNHRFRRLVEKAKDILGED